MRTLNGRRGTLCACSLLCALSSVLAIVPLANQSPPATATSARAWLGQEQKIEDHLRNAEVSRIESIQTGVTRPRRVFLTPAVPFGSMAWKVLPPGRRAGYWESYKSEIAAYELDKLLAMHMVPPAVERRVGGEVGAAIMWLEGIRSVKETGGQVPSGPQWGSAIRKMLMFDHLIANSDRNAGNILIGPPGELILIDHSRAFADGKLPQEITRVNAQLFDRMKALTREDLARALGSWLDRDAIDAIVERRDRMTAAVDRLVARRGRAQVIIP